MRKIDGTFRTLENLSYLGYIMKRWRARGGVAGEYINYQLYKEYIGSTFSIYNTYVELWRGTWNARIRYMIHARLSRSE